MTKQAELIAYIFSGQPHRLSSTLLEWLEASPRFTAFVDIYRDKIRKKIRSQREPDSLFDLQAELEAAYRLLVDRRLEVAYEPYANEKRRGPDFAVTYRVNLVLNIEVARIRPEKNEEIDLGRKQERIVRILLDKLGQMQAGMPNLLVIQTQAELARSIDLGRLMQAVKSLVDRKEPAFYALSRYSDPAAFYKDFLRLSGIILWGDETQLWINKQRRPDLDEKVIHLIAALLSGEGKA